MRSVECPNRRPHAPLGEASVLIVGLARNCGRFVAPDVERLARAFGAAKRLRWFLVESDSADATVAKLDELVRRIPGFAYTSLGNLEHAIPNRTERIAHCRNRYLAKLRDAAEHRDVDYVVVADFDGVNSCVSAAAIASCWERNDWDACTANQTGPYYDIWALRHPEWSPNDCHRQRQFMARFLSDKASANGSVNFRMITIPPMHDWIEVQSAFGGLAIYRCAALLHGNYRGWTDCGHEVCEHVPLHAELTRRGHRLFINPRLINANYTDHTRHLLVHRRLWGRLNHAARTAACWLFGEATVTTLVRRLRGAY